MALVLLLILVITEIGFAVFELTKNTTKKNWTMERLGVNGAEAVIYLIMLALPGIDFSFRFKSLVLLLAIRIIFAFIFLLINRKNEKIKKKVFIILGSFFTCSFIISSLAPAFIFKDYKGRPLTGSYEVAESEAILIDHSRVESFEDDGSYREVPVHFYYPENVQDIKEHSLPLVIFSHGAFGYYQSNTSTYMELASHGYVVVSLDHPYHSFFTKDSEGKTIIANPEFFQDALRIGNSDGEVSEEEIYETTSKWMELRIADMNFVIDTLENTVDTNNMDDSWFISDESKDNIINAVKLINIEKIGLMGHSLGGATAVTVGRRDDISAVIDLDGTMLGEQIGVKDENPIINEEPYTTPLLSVDKEDHYQERIEAEKIGYNYANNVILKNATNGYSTFFKGAEHMNFTDLPLFSPTLAGMLGTGNIDAGECIDQVNGLVLEFFDSFLKESGEFTVQESY